MFLIFNRALPISVLLLFLAGLAIVAPQANAAPRSFETAVIDADAFEHGTDAAFDHAADTGAKFIKNNLYWNFIVANRDSDERPGTEVEPFDPTDPGSPYYSWSTFDRMVRMADARGLEVVFSVVGTPRWARINACKGTSVCSPVPADYADFATAAAKRYSGSFDPGNGQGILPRVRYWQAWVEPNLYLFYKPIFRNGKASAPGTFRNILNAFYDAVHAVDNSNFVIAGGLAPNAVPRKAIAPLSFTRMVLCMAGNFRNPKPNPNCSKKTKADAWSVHPYTTGSPVHLPSNGNNMTVAALPRMNKLLAAARKSKRLTSVHGPTQLWATEFSWDSNPPDPGGVPAGLLKRWVSQAMYMMYKSNVRMLSWFGLRDHARAPGQKWSESFESGLYFRGATVAEDRPKPVLKAFRQPFYAETIQNGRKGFRFWGRTADSKPVWVDIFARRKNNGKFFRMKTVRANANGIFQGAVRKRGFTKRGSAYAKPRKGKASYAFGLWKTVDCRQPPFGANKFDKKCFRRG